MARPVPLLADDDLAELVGVGGVGSIDDPRLRRAVREASAEFRSAIHNPLTRVVGDEREYDGDGTSIVRLNVWHPKIESVAVGGIVLPDGAVQASRVGLMRLRDGSPWPYGYGNIEVTLDHGHTEVPEDVRSVILESAALRLTVPVGIKQAGLGSHNVTFETVGTTEAWASAVQAYRLGEGDRA